MSVNYTQNQNGPSTIMESTWNSVPLGIKMGILYGIINAASEPSQEENVTNPSAKMHDREQIVELIPIIAPILLEIIKMCIENKRSTEPEGQNDSLADIISKLLRVNDEDDRKRKKVLATVELWNRYFRNHPDQFGAEVITIIDRLISYGNRLAEDKERSTITTGEDSDLTVPAGISIPGQSEFLYFLRILEVNEVP